VEEDKGDWTSGQPQFTPFKLSDVCRVMCGIKDRTQYIWTNIQQGNVNMNLMLLLVHKTSNEKDSNENEI
jgi:hypothetical protein